MYTSILKNSNRYNYGVIFFPKAYISEYNIHLLILIYIFNGFRFFKVYPAEQIPVDLAIDENRIAALNVTFKTIFPAPVCSASDDVSNKIHKKYLK